VLKSRFAHWHGGMAVYLFAGIAGSDFAAALAWYESLLGSPPSSFPHNTEAVWEVAEHRLMYVVQRPEDAGHALQTLIVDDLDTRIAGLAQRDLEPAGRETYPNGVRKMTYLDPDGNEVGLGEVPG
jgi:catechol 2,3-dioxygenase-like lactoylglutathione lyase family enzyme